MDDIIIKKIIQDSKKLINENIYLYLIHLFKFIFFKSNRLSKANLDTLTNHINENILKDKYRYINYSYDRRNFKNIIYFVNIQNKKFCGDIIEGILILIFSKAIKVDKSKTFGKYIFNNISKLKDANNDKDDLLNWFKNGQEKFNHKELNNFMELLKKENEGSNKERLETPIFNLLYEIIRYKFLCLNNRNQNDKTLLYINKGICDTQKLNEYIFNHIKTLNIHTSATDRDINYNSLETILQSYCCYSYLFGIVKNIPIQFFRGLLISVFIYYQNKNSPLMKYEPKFKKRDYNGNSNNVNNNNKTINNTNNTKSTKDNSNLSNNEVQKNDHNGYNNNENANNLVDLPFEYDIKSAAIEGKLAYIVLSPLRIEPRISKIILAQNNLRDPGIFEMSKILIFNPNIEKLEYNISLIKSYYLDYFNFGLGLFDNFSIKELNLSYNYLKEDSGEYLSKILSHLKGLKTLNLSGTDLKSGLSYVFILLKKLYRKHKINLENLYLNKCNLDDTSYYELGELLKSKYCKLKRIFLTVNCKTNNFNFLKKLKKNTSLEEINFIKGDYGNLDTKDINKIISFTNLKHIYLSRNRINNFNNCIRIIYRTKLINENNVSKNENQNGIEKNENIIIGNIPKLINLDLSNNEAFNLNKVQVNLIDNIIKETTLKCLDLSHILFGPNPEKTLQSESYQKHVKNIKDSLKQKKNFYKAIFSDNYSKKIDINNLQYLESDETINKIKSKYEILINKAIDDENAIYFPFLIENAKEIIDKISENKEEEKYIINNAVLENGKNSDNSQLIIKLAKYMKLKLFERVVNNNDKKLDKKKLILL